MQCTKVGISIDVDIRFPCQSQVCKICKICNSQIIFDVAVCVCKLAVIGFVTVAIYIITDQICHMKGQ